MTKFIINPINKQQNKNRTNLDLSGLHSIINLKTNSKILYSVINGSIIADNSNLITNDNFNIDKILALNNSNITTLDEKQIVNNNLRDKYINVNNNSNSLYNLNYPIISDIPITTIGNSLYKYQNNNEQLNYTTWLSEIVWNPYLLNNGSKFIWYQSESLSSYYLVNHKNENIVFSPRTCAICNEKIKHIPKNLYNKKLIIDLPNNLTNNNTILIENFFNGTVQIHMDVFSNGILKCQNIQNLILKFKEKNYLNQDLNSNLNSKEPFKKIFGKIILNKIENCIIEELTFVNTINNSNDYKYKYIDSITYSSVIENQDELYNLSEEDANLYIVNHNYNYNYIIQKNIINNQDNPFTISIINSNVILRNCTFNKCKQLNIYCTLNSKLTAYNNIFNFIKNLGVFVRRPILYYISKNSFCTATNDIISYNIYTSSTTSDIDLIDYGRYIEIIKQNDESKIIYYSTGMITSSIIFGNLNLNSNKYQNFNYYNNSIHNQQYLETNKDDKFTYIYGFAYPGSFFNHQHKSKLLTRKQLTNGDLIKNKQLPICSMYQIPRKIIDEDISKKDKQKLLDGSKQYDNTKTIGYHIADCNSTYIGISYLSGYYSYKIYPQKKERTLLDLQKTLQKINSEEFITNIIFPNPSDLKRYKSQYADNLKYAKIIRHHFNLKTSPYFNSSLLSTTSNLQNESYVKNKFLISVPTSLLYSTDLQNKKMITLQTHILAIQYNQFVHYNKLMFQTNIDNKFQDMYLNDDDSDDE